MLRGIHEASKNWLGKVVMAVLFGLIAISFAVWGIGDIFRGFGQSTVASIGGVDVTIEQYRIIYNDRLQQISRQLGRALTPDQIRGLGFDQQILGQFVAETALDQHARSLGLAVPDEAIVERIMSDPNFRSTTGQFDRLRFEFTIRQAGYTEQRYVAEQRDIMLRRELAGTVTAGPLVPHTAVQALNSYQNEQRSIEYVKIEPALAGEIESPSPGDLAAYFDSRKAAFRAPEYRRISVIALDPKDVAAEIVVTDEEVKQAYESNRDRYSTPERRHIQQVVFQNEEDAKAFAEKAKSGAWFAVIAAERELSAGDIDLGTITKAQMIDPALADAAFALAEGGVSDPVRGRFGIAVLHVVKIEPGKDRTLEEAAPEIRQQLAQSRAVDRIIELYDKIEDERAAGLTLAEAGSKLGLAVRTIEAADRSGRDPAGTALTDLPAGNELVQAAFETNVGIENDPLETGNRGYVWYDVVSVTPSRERTLDEVRQQVEDRWRLEQMSARLKAKTEEMVAKLKSGTPLAELASSMGLAVQTANDIKRAGGASLPKPVVDAVFRTAQGEAGNAEGGTPPAQYLFRVTAASVPELASNSSVTLQLSTALQNTMREDVLGQYLAHVRDEVGVTINQDALSQATGASSN